MYRKEGNELIPIVPRDRLECDMSHEEGEIPCDCSGVCKFFSFSFLNNLDTDFFFFYWTDVVEFDNSYSYFRSKKIWYSITVYNGPTEKN